MKHIAEIVHTSAEQKEFQQFTWQDTSTSVGISNHQLLSKIQSYAFGMLQHVKPGDTVILMMVPGLDYVYGYFACLYAGAIPIPVYPPVYQLAEARLRPIVENSKSKLILTNNKTLQYYHWTRFKNTIRNLFHTEQSDQQWLSSIPRITLESLHTDESLPAPLHNQDNIAFIQYTSSSTGDPKGVVITHQNLLEHCRILNKHQAFNAEDRLVSWLPPYHDMGLIGCIIQPIHVQAEAILMSPHDFIIEPLSWLKALDQHKSTVTCAPNFALAKINSLLRNNQSFNVDLSSLNICICGAEPIQADTVVEFEQHIKRFGVKSPVIKPAYGLAEATLTVSFHQSKQLAKCIKDPTGEKEVISCGEILPEVNIRIVDNEIFINSKSIAQGYYNNEKLTEDYFRNNIDGDYYFKTGDLGFIEDNCLYINGRKKDLIIINGRNYYPQDLEQIAEASCDAIRKGRSVAFCVTHNGDSTVTLIVETSKKPSQAIIDEINSTIKKHISKQLELNKIDIVVAVKDSILKTSSGKLRRQPTKKLYLTGGIKSYHHVDSGIEHLAEKLKIALEEYDYTPSLENREKITVVDALFETQTINPNQLSRDDATELTRLIAYYDICTAINFGLKTTNNQFLLKHASQELLKEYSIVNDKKLATSFCITEECAGSNISNIQTRLIEEEDHYILNGRKIWSGLAQIANFYIVLAKSKDTKSGFSLIVVPQELPGITIEAEALTLGLKGMYQNAINFCDVKCPKHCLIGVLGDGLSIAKDTINATRHGLLGVCLGVCERLVKEVADYASQRKIATGLLINNGVFAYKFNLIKQAKNTLQSIYKNTNNNAQDELSSVLIKVYATEACFNAIDTAMQLVGGRSYINDHILARYFTDARIMRIFEGSNELLLSHAGKLLIDQSDNNTINYDEPELNKAIKEIKTFSMGTQQYQLQQYRIAQMALRLLVNQYEGNINIQIAESPEHQSQKAQAVDASDPIKKIINQELRKIGVESVDYNQHYSYLGLSSIDIPVLLNTISKHIQKEIPPYLLFEGETLNDFIRNIQQYQTPVENHKTIELVPIPDSKIEKINKDLFPLPGMDSIQYKNLEQKDNVITGEATSSLFDLGIVTIYEILKHALGSNIEIVSLNSHHYKLVLDTHLITFTITLEENNGEYIAYYNFASGAAEGKVTYIKLDHKPAQQDLHSLTLTHFEYHPQQLNFTLGNIPSNTKITDILASHSIRNLLTIYVALYLGDYSKLRYIMMTSCSFNNVLNIGKVFDNHAEQIQFNVVKHVQEGNKIHCHSHFKLGNITIAEVCFCIDVIE